MSKIGLHDSFGHFKHKLWPNEGPRVKLAIWLPTTKSRESPRFPYVQVVCEIPLEIFWQGLKISLDLISIRGLHAKLWAPKVTGILAVGILGLPLGNPRTKWHLGASPMAKHIVYYKGEGGGFPEVWVVVSLTSLSLPMVHPSTKSVPNMH
jgi:hypothetical protein